MATAGRAGAAGLAGAADTAGAAGLATGDAGLAGAAAGLAGFMAGVAGAAALASLVAFPGMAGRAGAAGATGFALVAAGADCGVLSTAGLPGMAGFAGAAGATTFSAATDAGAGVFLVGVIGAAGRAGSGFDLAIGRAGGWAMGFAASAADTGREAPPTVICPRNLLTKLSGKFGMFFRSFTDLKGPFSERYRMIASALASPIPLRESSSSFEAVLILI